MSQSRIQVYQYFQTDDVPTEAQFQYLFNNLWFKDEKMSISDITGLEDMFQNTLSVEQLENHIEDVNAHTQLLAKLDGTNIDVEAWKTLLEIVQIATIDDGDFQGNVYTKEQIQATVNELLLNIDVIRETLQSDDVNLDELQEVVNYVKENREMIELLQQISVGNTTDDRITLTGSYPNWGVNLQNQLNELLYDRITSIESAIETWGKLPHREAITGDAVINHDLDTLDFVCEAYDTITLFKIPVRVRILNHNSIEIQFDDQPINPIQITIRKI